MTPEQQRIAISKICGWIWHGDASWIEKSEEHYWKKEGDELAYQILPDYLNDLNAMHEAEKKLPDYHHMEKYWEKLRSMPHADDYGMDMHREIYSKADKRAEAFLKTIGKWIE